MNTKVKTKVDIIDKIDNGKEQQISLVWVIKSSTFLALTLLSFANPIVSREMARSPRDLVSNAGHTRLSSSQMQ